MTAFLFSCEYATCAVPEAYREIFRGSEDVLTSPEGWEPGALNLAQAFAMRFRTPLVHGDVTRLLVDCEKDGDERWSRFSMQLSEATREKIAERYVAKPYRELLRQRITEDLRRHSCVMHVMVHTDEKTDGQITLETPAGAVLAEKFATAWRSGLDGKDIATRHIRNAPSHSLGAMLSAAFPADRYAQVRLQVSQSFFLEGKPWRWDAAKKLLLDSLAIAVADVSAAIAPESPSTAPD